ncbi:hypothetical protein N7466_011114 [Penicillium verhagenii]|uniref:uncharacterized protein n=1 Tax=Penicillium verhagenii TaxID=1562060 RepID=UPI002545BD98|nr:uncharacterized protein N7466_011114 [Penicillium verhagenii]KAJ5917560.1 hypothetical protein N7466_011114 [Penicillium verhagenii]
MQHLHLTLCVWQIIFRNLKHDFETRNTVTRSSTAFLSPKQPLPEAASASTLPEKEVTERFSMTLEERKQEPQQTYSPESSQTLQPLLSASVATSGQDQRPTSPRFFNALSYLPQLPPRIYQSALSPKCPFTIKDLSRRFYRKISPLRRDMRNSKRSVN